MEAYKLETTVTDDGKIILPKDFNKIFNRKVEVLLLNTENESQKKPKKLHIHTFKCGGKLKDFTREELYEVRL
jgi:hypothetical protein